MPTKKTTKRRPSVDILLNSTCTDGRQFSDCLTSAAGDQLENRDNGGGEIIILAKKGPLFVRRLSVFGCSQFPPEQKKLEKGRARKKNGGNEWTGPPIYNG